MPEVSGNFLIKLIRTYEHLRTVPIVAVTSDTDDETREGILRKGANRVMYKPVDKAKIVDCVRRSIESHRKLTLQLSKAKSREQAQSEQKNAEQISLESNLRNLMR
jgi:DNA-binding NarL/FixJ family response regulator